MAIELTYGDDADQQDIDRAIVQAVGQKGGYVVGVSYGSFESPTVQDVVIQTDSPSGLCVRAFDEEAAEPFGPIFWIPTDQINSIEIY